MSGAAAGEGIGGEVAASGGAGGSGNGSQQGEAGAGGASSETGTGANGEWPEGAGGEGSSASTAGDDEFNRSLGDFDNVMAGEQDQMARAGVGRAADQVLGSGADGSGDTNSDTNGTVNGHINAGDADGQQDQQGSTGSSSGDSGNAKTTSSVKGCNDSDKVARQLCEAATKEQDPFLRASLWDEYNEYKKILARQ